MDTKWYMIGVVGLFLALGIGAGLEAWGKSPAEVARYQAIQACYTAGQTDCSEKIR